MKRSASLVILIILMNALFATGCENKKADKGNGLNIYYTAIESGDYYEDWANKLQEQADKQGAAFDVGYAENRIELQDAQIKKAVEGDCDVFLCGAVSSNVISQIKAAKGKPIVFINNAPSDGQLEKDQYIYVASDEFMAGQYQAEYILEQLADKDEINVAILKGPSDASGTVGRTSGLKQTLKASGKKINYVFEDNADWNRDTAKELMEMFLKTGISVDCVAANNDDMACGGIDAFEQAGVNMDSVLFLGVDASKGGCEAIAQGKMDFTVYQPMEAQMAAAVEAAGKLADGKSIDDIDGASADGKYILIPFEKVDAKNVSKYQ